MPTLRQNFSHATIATALNKDKTWQQAVFTEVVQTVHWSQDQTQIPAVYTVVELLLAELTLNGLFLKNPQLSQPRQQVVLGVL
jgi:hypothetical protein